MKGLLLKDWYLITRYCRAFFVLDLVFIPISLYQAYDTHQYFSLFLIYPCLLAALLPITLYSYDEREKWCSYSAALPVSRAQYVSAKYTVGLLSMAAVLLVCITAHEVARRIVPWNVVGDYASLLLGVASLSLAAPAVVMPLMLRFGAEKGRIIYYVMIGVICAVTLMMINDDGGVVTAIGQPIGIPAACVLALALYAGSWLLSIFLYRKRAL